MSKRSLEGYLMIDHRASPGLPWLPKFYEAPTKTCAHCGTVTIINPDRKRDRAYCSKCDNYICDNCDLERKSTGYVHVSRQEIIESAIKRNLYG